MLMGYASDWWMALQADEALTADDWVNFANKIVMSIAIRLLAEQHMIEDLADPEFTTGIAGQQTQTLYQAYKNRGHGDEELFGPWTPSF